MKKNPKTPIVNNSKERPQTKHEMDHKANELNPNSADYRGRQFKTH